MLVNKGLETIGIGVSLRFKLVYGKKTECLKIKFTNKYGDCTINLLITQSFVVEYFILIHNKVSPLKRHIFDQWLIFNQIVLLNYQISKW